MNFKKLEQKSQELRKYIFSVVKKRGGHLSTAYSATEILTVLYYTNLLNINHKNYKKKIEIFFSLVKVMEKHFYTQFL